MSEDITKMRRDDTYGEFCRTPKQDDDVIVDVDWCNRQEYSNWTRSGRTKFRYWLHDIRIEFAPGGFMPMLYVGGNHVAGEVTRGKIRHLMEFLKADFNEVF